MKGAPSPLTSRRRSRVASLGTIACLSIFATGCSSTPQPSTPPAVTLASWQHHHATFYYYGLTSLYTCDGLKEKVRQILLYLGARPDLKVETTACARLVAPVHSAYVTADFDTLTVANSSTSPTVKGYWKPFVVAPHRPYFMGVGECELINQMKPSIIAGFSLRDLHYDTSCFPRSVTIADYGVKGETLQTAG
jgi:hypothetical protein